MRVLWQNKEVRVTFFVAAILGTFRRARHVVSLGKCDSIRLGVKVWVKPQSILTSYEFNVDTVHDPANRGKGLAGRFVFDF